MKIRLRHKIVGLAILSALIPVVTLLIMMVSQQDRLKKRFDDDFQALVDKDIKDNISNLWNMCHVLHEMIQYKVHASTRIAQHLIHEWGPVSLSEDKIVWRCENQANRDFYFYELPKIIIGQHTIEQNFNEAVPSPIVDDIKVLTRETVSIFQRINEEGDMLRVATTLLKSDGSRDIAQYLEANNKEIDPEQTIAKVLQGETTLSSINLMDEWYIIGSAPIKETVTGKVIGMVRTAVNERSLFNLNRILEEMSSSSNGFLWILRGHPKKETNLFIYPKISEQNYLELNHIVQEKGLHFFENIRRNAISAPLGQIFTQTFEIENSKTHAAQMAIIKYVYFPKWDWIIGIMGSETDYEGIHKKLRTPFEFLVQSIIWAIIIGLSMVIFISLVLSEKISAPISDLTNIASKVADGNLHMASDMIDRSTLINAISIIETSYSDETSQLFSSTRRMIINLNALLVQIKQNTNNLIKSAHYLTETSAAQEQAVGNFNSLSSTIVTTVDKISNTSLQLYQTMCNLSEMTNQTGKAANQGKAKVQGIENSLEFLVKLGSTISNKLLAVKQRTININSIIDNISKVANQADVLSVNSAIEAEKIGEYGRGFRIIAKQIGQLADQTTLAINDAQYMSNEINSMIEGVIKEMEKFNQEVTDSFHSLNSLSNGLQSIIEQVQILSPEMDNIKKGMESQYQGAKQISQTTLRIATITEQATKSLSDFIQTKDTLTQIIVGFKSEISQFETLDSLEIRPSTSIVTIESSHSDLN